MGDVNGPNAMRRWLQTSVEHPDQSVGLTDSDVEKLGGYSLLKDEFHRLPPEKQRAALPLLTQPKVRAGLAQAIAPDFMKRWDVARRDGVVTLGEAVMGAPNASLRRDLSDVPADLRQFLLSPVLAGRVSGTEPLPETSELFEQAMALVSKPRRSPATVSRFLDYAAQMATTEQQQARVRDVAKRGLEMTDNDDARVDALSAWSRVATAEEAPLILRMAQEQRPGTLHDSEAMLLETQVRLTPPEARAVLVERALASFRKPDEDSWGRRLPFLKVLALDPDAARRALHYDDAMQRYRELSSPYDRAIALDAMAQLAATPGQRQALLRESVAVYSLNDAETANEARRVALRAMARLTDDPDARGDIARMAMFHFDPGYTPFRVSDLSRARCLLAAWTALR
jgi:hypothetical protein